MVIAIGTAASAIEYNVTEGPDGSAPAPAWTSAFLIVAAGLWVVGILAAVATLVLAVLQIRRTRPREPHPANDADEARTDDDRAGA